MDLLESQKLYKSFRKVENIMKAKTLMPVIKAILNDEEFLCGGIFTKEKQYAKKYNLTMEEIGNIQTCLYYALHIKDECYNERINHLCDWEVGNMNIIKANTLHKDIKVKPCPFCGESENIVLEEYEHTSGKRWKSIVATVCLELIEGTISHHMDWLMHGIREYKENELWNII